MQNIDKLDILEWGRGLEIRKQKSFVSKPMEVGCSNCEVQIIDTRTIRCPSAGHSSKGITENSGAKLFTTTVVRSASH